MKKYAPNDKVIYGSNGVCTLVEITQKDFGGQVRDYYVLRPETLGTSVFYVPVDSPLSARIRPVKSAAELQDLIAACEVSADEWITDDRTRQLMMKQTVEEGDTHQLLRLFKLLRLQQRQLQQNGKKLRAADDRFMRDIRTILTDELLLSVSMPKEEAADYLLGALEI